MPPFVAPFGPRADLEGALVAAVVLALAAWLLPRLLSERVHPGWFALATFAATLALRVALAPARAGTGQWTRVFELERFFDAKNEYLPALVAFDNGWRFVVDRFAELIPALPVHAAGHPPGLLLVMHALDLDTAGRLAAFCIVVGAFAAPLTYVIARAIVPERDGADRGAADDDRARSAAVRGGLGGRRVPDPGALAAWPLACASRWARLARRAGARRRVAVRVVAAGGRRVGGAARAAAGGLAARARARGGLRRGAGGAARGLAALRAATRSGRCVDGVRLPHRRRVRAPVRFWLLGSPVAFLVALGMPIAWLALRALAAGETATRSRSSR